MQPQQQQQQVAPPPPAPIDPVEELMAEYKKLEADPPGGPMYSPDQANQRIDRNNTMTQLGILGSMSGDKGVQNTGAQVFKQALGEGAERRTDRGIVDPLTGTETLDPEYQRAQRETRRGQVLQRALAYQQAREGSADRRDAAFDRNQAMRDAAQTRADAVRDRAAAAGDKAPNMVQIKDDATGKTYWANPKTGQTMGEVQLPTPSGGTPGNNPLVRPDKMSGPDEGTYTKLVTQEAAIDGALAAVAKNKTAFGPMKGSADMLPTGVAGSVGRYVRDKNLSNDQLIARSLVYNNMSAIIKDRAGTAQSAQELKRLNGFLPSELDDDVMINAKLSGFKQYLAEQKQAMHSKYAGPRPMQHMGGGGAAPANGGWSIQPAD